MIAIDTNLTLAELRARGHHDPIYFHGAIERLNQLYQSFGIELGELRHTGGASKAEMAGHTVIAPPGALNDRWSRRLPDPVTAMASLRSARARATATASRSPRRRQRWFGCQTGRVSG